MEELLSLKWNNHRSTFLHILAILRDKQAYTDVTLACDGKFYNVHKLVLSTCSDYFSAMFDKTDKTCKSPIIVLKDIKCEDLESLLDYMYLGEVNVRQCDLASLIKSAECLRIKGLAVPDDEPPKKVPNRTESNRTESNRRDNVSGSPPPKRKRRDEGEDGRDDVRPIEPSPQPSTSRPKNDSSQRLSPSPHRTPQESPKVEERLIRPPPTSESRPLPSTSGTSGGGGGGGDTGGGGGSSGGGGGGSSGGVGVNSGGASVSGGASGGTVEQFRTQSENQTFVKVEVDDNESHDDSQIDSYNMGTDGYKEESEGDFGDLSNDLPEFLQQASSGSLQGSSFHQFPGPSGFQDASGSSWQGDGQSLGNFSGLGFSHQEGSQNPGIGGKQLGNVCMICGKVFNGRNWKQNLEYHLLSHTKYKPFKCPVCTHSSSLKYNLIRHIRNKHKELYPQQEDSHVENFGIENHGESIINKSDRISFFDESFVNRNGSEQF